jgi:hypothetical protein
MIMQEPTQPGYYWIQTQPKYWSETPWEIAYWSYGAWDVIGRDYTYTSKDLGLVRWVGPILPPEF